MQHLTKNSTGLLWQIEYKTYKNSTMDFHEIVQLLADRISNLKDNVANKEGTKNAFVLPLIQTLGYDLFNPLEVVPEYSSDLFGTPAQTSTVDYAIIKDDHPIILFKCEHWENDLNKRDETLASEFNKSQAKFGINTNGIVYKIYSDLSETGKMDKEPFLEIDLSEIDDRQINELKKFHKKLFNTDNILHSVNEKYVKLIKEALENELNDPSPEFIKILIKSIHSGTVTKKVQEQFTPLVKKTISGYLTNSLRKEDTTTLQPVDIDNDNQNTESDLDNETSEFPKEDVTDVNSNDITDEVNNTPPPMPSETSDGQFRHRRYRKHLR